jgi:hypothetical protein
MTLSTNYLNEAYARLACILQRPEIFGLGATVPQPLANALEGAMGSLGRAIDEEDQAIPEETLEEELHQDADQFVATAC